MTSSVPLAPDGGIQELTEQRQPSLYRGSLHGSRIAEHPHKPTGWSLFELAHVSSNALGDGDRGSPTVSSIGCATDEASPLEAVHYS
jgi:hypothetical protein